MRSIEELGLIAAKSNIKELEVTPEEYVNCAVEASMTYDPYPTPPIVSRTTTRSFGFFGASSTTAEEVDWQDPEFLKKREAYNARYRNKPNLHLYGKKLVIKDIGNEI